ncbi:hypothetical protein BDM02DRAFT_3155049 [Thelephora ganbajun]|uniref:Uncharacterized protein n=1 Tax=Thelephora ganbajun TaxID=370292 RepID=A0ACB6ZLQ3_THEGA|nr:hypothetical protein BDM02DRAFT_3155049 [Thelephora ganbajun]
MLTFKYIALSTQSVGVGPGILVLKAVSVRSSHHSAAISHRRVAIVDYRGSTVLDYFVKPTLPVSDYRTNVTGISPQDLESDNALPFDDVQSRVASVIASKIIVGHSLWNDFSVLGLPHPAVATRDVALYRPFRTTLRSNHVIGLQTLMWHLMNRQVQKEHVVPLENVRAVIDLYRSVETDCEASIAAGDWPFLLPPENFARCYL